MSNELDFDAIKVASELAGATTFYGTLTTDEVDHAVLAALVEGSTSPSAEDEWLSMYTIDDGTEPGHHNVVMVQHVVVHEQVASWLTRPRERRVIRAFSHRRPNF